MRPATINDLEDIFRTISADMSNGHFENIPAQQFRNLVGDCIKGEMSDEHGRRFKTWAHIYEVDGRFVGCAIARGLPITRFKSNYPENTRELWMLSVKPEERGHKHGKHFAGELINQYSDCYLIGICKEASKNMVHILKSFGFLELGKFRGGDRETLLFLDRSGVAGEVQAKMRANHVLE